ncbi:MAG: FHA domain-containing protein [Vulcanimicrobiota bacterium]
MAKFNFAGEQAPPALSDNISQTGMKKRFLLYIIKGRDAGQVVELGSSITLLGRLEASIPSDPKDSKRMVIADMAVSRTHCQIVFTNQGPVLYHMSTTNATYVNQQAVTEHVLIDGEIIQMGHTQVRFQVEVEGEEDYGPGGDWSNYGTSEPWIPDSYAAWEPERKSEETWVPC